MGTVAQAWITASWAWGWDVCLFPVLTFAASVRLVVLTVAPMRRGGGE